MLLISGRTSTPSQPWFSVCENKHKVYQEEAEVAVLEGIGKQILTPEAVDYIVGQALQNLKLALKRPDDRQEHITGLQADLTVSKRILERLSQALVNANTPWKQSWRCLPNRRIEKRSSSWSWKISSG